MPPPHLAAAAAAALAASARATRTTSVTCPTPNNADSAILSASCTQRCATETPNGDTVRRGPGEAERPLDNECCCTKAEFGATSDYVAELPPACPLSCAEEAVSSKAAPTAC